MQFQNKEREVGCLPCGLEQHRLSHMCITCPLQSPHHLPSSLRWGLGFPRGRLDFQKASFLHVSPFAQI